MRSVSPQVVHPRPPTWRDFAASAATLPELTDGPDDKEAFEAVFAEFGEAVFRYALRRLGNEVDAEDALAETFAVAWRRWAVVPDGRELPWLYGVARRVIANQRRSSGRRLRLRSRLSAEPETHAQPAATGEHDAPLEVLAMLSPADQEVLRLVLWEELPTADVAEALGIKEGAVYVRLHRARRRFAARYEQLQQERRETEGEA
jgi:RNA polymerase sigma factor (sigma-70 family)